MDSNTSTTRAIEPEQTAGQVINVGHLLDYLKWLKDNRKRRGIRYRLDVMHAFLKVRK
jgi:hypothetical protein